MADESRHPVVGDVPDREREYTPSENERLALQLLELQRDLVDGRYTHEPPGEPLLRLWHERLFGGVRDHAGRCRSRDFGSDYLTYGPHRSPIRDQVSTLLAEVFVDVARSLASFEQSPDDPNYERYGFQLAVWAHARVVRIHPFEDGNGRTSRILLDWILLRLGFRPVPIEAVKQEYLDCLNHYYTRGDITLLVDLYLRLYFEQLQADAAGQWSGGSDGVEDASDVPPPSALSEDEGESPTGSSG